VGGVFISYRGEDSQSYGALIYSELSRRFGVDQVFLDSESTLAGEDFVEVMLGRLRQCSVVLAVIGPRWLTVTDAAGRRRIDSPEDWIRRELVEAFAQRLQVIPILTEGVQIPGEADLPTDIAALHRRQALRVHHRNTSHDLARIVEELTRLDQGLAQAARRRDGIPRQLPSAPRLFTGRARELTLLSGALNADAEQGATAAISAIGGAGGIGKTWLALHWAHQNVQRFPDGQLYVNLRGFDPSGSPTPPGVAVQQFLDALGLEPSAIPRELDAQAALYRSLVAGRQMLIVLDNASDTAQVAPLLPGDPTCTVVVTSRHQLAALGTAHGARLLDLDVLTEADARELLTRRLGSDRVVAEPEAVAELLERCAGLPLALGIVAARAAAHPDFPLAVLAEELHNASDRLDALDAGELSVRLRAVFSWSYHALDAETANVFQLLGLAPGPDIGLPAAASLTGQSTLRARALLRDLETAYLVQQHAPDRYRLHDLIQLYAAERARHDQSEDSRNAALRRLVDFYTHTAHTGNRLLAPHASPIEVGVPATGCVPHPLEDGKSALEWFDIEHRCLLAAQQLAAKQDWHTLVWQLAWTLSNFHARRGHLPDHVTTWRTGLAAAERMNDPGTLALAYRSLGRACARAGMHTEALDHLQQALILAEQTGDRYLQAHTHHALTQAWEQRDDHQQALTHAAHMLRLFETLNDSGWQAAALNAIGWYHARLGHHQQARTYCESALTMHRHHHNRVGEAETLDSLGYIAHHTGQHTDAIGYYHQTLALYRDIGHTYEQANTLAHLAEAHAALGQHDDARVAWQQALDLYSTQHRTADAERIRRQLDLEDIS
jgi:tetratricopeptide (TPR) repeat protein